MGQKVRVAINGFGRIGRVVTRRLLEETDHFELVAINDLTPLEQNAHLLKYDSVHGTLGQDVKASEGKLQVGSLSVPVFTQRDPSELPWKKLGVDMAFECTGIFTDYSKASLHLQAGAKRVLLSAPTKSPDQIKTMVYGINHDTFNAQEDKILSNGSCTTNCLAPIVKVLHDKFGVDSGLMTTIHSYTNDQRILDVGHSDYRRMRAAALNMIPTSTGAAKAVALVMPELAGKLTGLAVRVPTPNVSLVDFVAYLQKEVTVESVNEALIAASEGPLKNILKATQEPLVSTDFNGSTASSTVDLPSTQVIGKKMVKVLSWYDNESGFSQRMLDLAKFIQSKS